MSFFVTTTMREAKRMTALRESYEKQLEALPKGSLRVKERNGKKYFYLSYRSEGKVVSEYVGNDESVIDELKERLERRKGVEALIKGIKKELALMNKILEVAK
ncbi:hypothetical protein LJB90_00590 [Eubacteriales bacterium OttesenSCG-928-G02]|nr:hypothetical protein [Eubacteriales bacterium OttesenSCG-928-G02]